MDNTKYLEGSSAQNHASLLGEETGPGGQYVDNGHFQPRFEFDPLSEDWPPRLSLSPNLASHSNKTPSQFFDNPSENVVPEPSATTHPPLPPYTNNLPPIPSPSFAVDPIPLVNQNAATTDFTQTSLPTFGYDSLEPSTADTSSTQRPLQPPRPPPQPSGYNSLEPNAAAPSSAQSSSHPPHSASQPLGCDSLAPNIAATSSTQQPSHPRRPPQPFGYNSLGPNAVATSSTQQLLHYPHAPPQPTSRGVLDPQSIYDELAFQQYQLIKKYQLRLQRNYGHNPMPGSWHHHQLVNQVGNHPSYLIPPDQYMPVYGRSDTLMHDPNQQALTNSHRQHSPGSSKKGRKRGPESDTDAEEDEDAGEKIVSSARRGRTHPSSVYPPFKQVFTYSLTWGSQSLQFTYTEEGVLTHRKRYSTAQLKFYVENCPRDLVMWVQNHPAQACNRTDRWDRVCRWDKCPSNRRKGESRGLIHPGWRRVAFDEFPHLTKNGEKDPFKVACVMHLYCFEQCFDPYEMGRRKMLRPDIRKFPKEDRSQFSLEREPCAGAVTAAFYPWMATIRQLIKMTGTTDVIPRPHEKSLGYALVMHHLGRQGGTRQDTRTKRNILLVEAERKTIDYHKGDLEKCEDAQERMVERKRKENVIKSMKKIKRDHAVDNLIDGGPSCNSSSTKDSEATSSQCANPQLHSARQDTERSNQETRDNASSPTVDINPLSTKLKRNPDETEGLGPSSSTAGPSICPVLDKNRVTPPADEEAEIPILDEIKVVPESEPEPGPGPSPFESLFGSPEYPPTPTPHHIHHDPASSSGFQVVGNPP